MSGGRTGPTSISNWLPDFRGFAILLVGIGYTAPPQASLSAKWRSNVTQIWATRP